MGDIKYILDETHTGNSQCGDFHFTFYASSPARKRKPSPAATARLQAGWRSNCCAWYPALHHTQLPLAAQPHRPQRQLCARRHAAIRSIASRMRGVAVPSEMRK